MPALVRSSRRTWLAKGPVLGLAAAACALSMTATAAAAAVPARGAGTTAPHAQSSTLDRFYRQQLDWGSCGTTLPPQLQCANVTVPLDYADPGGRTISVAISRVPATNPELRRGVMLLNPGGPGNSGLALPATLGGRMSPEVRSRYDLIGFDPRAVGRSTPISCGLTAEEGNYLLLPPQSFAADVRHQLTVAKKCVDRNGAMLRFITTRNTARDLDMIRGALGERKLSYLGYSYGTYLGSVYTQMFGDRADRIVLDSSVNPDAVWRGLSRAVAPAAERGLDRWAAWTAARNEQFGLGTSGPALRTRFNALLDEANRTPVPVDDWALSGETIRMIALQVMYDDRGYLVLSDLVRVALNGGRLIPPVHDYVAGATAPPSPDDNSVAAQLAIFCDDVAWPRDLDVYRSDKLRDGASYPFFGATASTVKPCTFWPYQPVEPVTAIGPGNSAPGILMVQSEFDVATPEAGARRLHTLLGNSRLVTLRNSQVHLVYAVYGNPCVDAAVTQYLVSGQLPESDMTCDNTPSANSTSLPAQSTL